MSGGRLPTSRKLGRRPPKNAPSLRFARFWTGAIPEHSPSIDHFSRITGWGLWRNDEFGDCGPVSYGNLRKLISLYLTGVEEDVTQDDVFALYKLVNPDFDPNDPGGPGDAGVDMQTMLEKALEHGFAGKKPLAFARVDHTNLDELRAAVDIFGGVLLGVDLETAQQDQTDAGLWDYKRSGEWGGHAVMCGRYVDEPQDSEDRSGVVTWGEAVDFTDAFAKHQLDEVWLVIFEEHFGSKGFKEGVDQQALARDFESLTGRSFPVQPGPQPSPTPIPPGPAPVPVGPADQSLAVTAHKWLQHRHVGENAVLAKELRAWLAAKQL